MKFHPLAELYPAPLDDAELGALVSDIRERGLLSPIVTFEGLILDGRKRFRACKLAGVKPRFEPYEGTDPVSAVLLLNAGRPMNESQRALGAARARVAILQRGASDTWQLRQGVDVAEFVARLANVSARSVYRAVKVLDSGDTDRIERVARGLLPVAVALRELEPRAARPLRPENVARGLERRALSLRDELREACADKKVRVILEDTLQELATEFFNLAEGESEKAAQ